jgi:hypothetical protein
MTRKLSFLIVVLVSLLGVVAAVRAADGDRVGFTLGCAGFTSRGGAVDLNRDNTGEGRELIYIAAIDGVGNSIYAPVEYSGTVGSSITFPPDLITLWTAQPQVNPLVLEIISADGNGLPVEVAYRVVGSCDGLANVVDGTAGSYTVRFGTELIAVTGRTSPPYPLNSIPPRPFQPEEVVEGEPGYAVVATDNLYIRTGPGVEYAPVGILDEGTRLIVLGRNRDDVPDDDDTLWWYVQVGGYSGWVKSNLLTLRGDLTETPIVESVGVPNLPRVISGFPTYPLFADADTDDQVCEVAGGLDYYVIGRNDNPFTAWQIEGICTDGRRVVGWVLAEDVTFRNPGSLVVPVTAGDE